MFWFWRPWGWFNSAFDSLVTPHLQWLEGWWGTIIYFPCPRTFTFFAWHLLLHFAIIFMAVISWHQVQHNEIIVQKIYCSRWDTLTIAYTDMLLSGLLYVKTWHVTLCWNFLIELFYDNNTVPSLLFSLHAMTRELWRPSGISLITTNSISFDQISLTTNATDNITEECDVKLF